MVCEIFDVTEETLQRWIKSGCPRNGDSTFDSARLIQWKIEREKTIAGTQTPDSYGERRNLELLKLSKDVELKDLQINEKKRNSIPLETHLRIVDSRAAHLSRYLYNVMDSNAYQLSGKRVEDVRRLLIDMVKVAMKEYLAGSVNLEKEIAVYGELNEQVKVDEKRKADVRKGAPVEAGSASV